MAQSTTSRKKRQALVLAGKEAGVTLIPSPTGLTRLNYFDGKFLRADDLRREQNYLRGLVALSNQAGCTGVVHGFSLTLGSGDSLELSSGLAIDGRGRVLLLPSPASIDVSELLEQSSRASADRAGTASGPARSRLERLERASERRRKQRRARTGEESASVGAFADCEPRAVAEPGPLEAAGLHLIAICHTEAYCGEEDVFGKLCEEACVTSTDRPFVVEGIVVRAIPLSLRTSLKRSGAVALTGRHLRSRVASAYFADERGRIASLISRSGLGSEAWCLGAEAEAAGCVPLGVLARAGDTTAFLDAWTARRERIETPPQKYWYGRFAMRPWNVFLAQVLQFQCQLRGCFGDGPDPGAGDPCDEAFRLIQRTSRTLAAMLEPEAGGGETTPILAPIRSPIRDVQAELAVAAERFFSTPRNRLLINCGIVETPAAGYLPVVPTSEVSVNEQVRRWFGEGVDLRFCVVRPDFIPHALEEAQHMERICLLSGLDDPSKLEEVDVLVPDGQTVSRAGRGTPLRAVVVLGENQRISLEGVARGALLDDGGIEFHVAGLGLQGRAQSNLTTLSMTGGRRVAGWLTLRLDGDPFEIEVGASVSGGVRVDLGVAGGELTDVRINDARFTLSELRPEGAGRVAIGSLAVSGVIEKRRASGGPSESETFQQTLTLQIVRAQRGSGTEVIRAFFPEEKNAPQFDLVVGGSPLTIRAEISALAGEEGAREQFATGNFLESAEVLDSASPLHVRADEALAALETRLGEPGFADRGRALLFGGTPGEGELDLVAVHDWVFFHRRRTKVCGVEERPRPPVVEPVATTCQEVWRLATTPEGFKAYFEQIPNENAVDLLREFGGERLGEVEFEEGTASVFGGSEGPVVAEYAALGDGRVSDVVVLAEAETGLGTNVPDPGLQLLLDQAGAVRDAIPGMSNANPVLRSPEVFAAGCPAITVLVTSPQAEPQLVCNEVFVVGGLRSVQSFDRLLVELRQVGLSDDTLRRLEGTETVGQALFDEATGDPDTDSLAEVVRKWQEVHPGVPNQNVGVRAISVSGFGSGAADEVRHRAQAQRIHQGIANTGVLESVIDVSDDSISSCPAVTILMAVRGG